MKCYLDWEQMLQSFQPFNPTHPTSTSKKHEASFESDKP